MNTGLIGVLWALVAVFGWGFGDYFIQKTSRELGVWKSLFFISLIGSVGLLPFVWNDLHLLLSLKAVFWTGIAGVAMTIGSIFVFESFKEGKLAVTEPIISAELPVAALLSVVVWGESLSFLGWTLVLVIFLGITLAITKHHTHLHYHKRIFEKGVFFAAIGALVNGLVDLLMGASSQEISPLLTVWGVWMIGLAITFIYLACRREAGGLVVDFSHHPLELVVLGILDTGAWIGFAFAVAYIPISVTVAITEGYILIGVLMGIFVNRERLRPHQIFGVIVAAIGVVILASVVG